MKIIYSPNVRSEYIDRGPNTLVDSYIGTGIAPHAATQRLSFTPSAGYRGLIRAISMQIYRVTAAGTLSTSGVYVTFNGGSGDQTFIRRDLYLNTVGAEMFVLITDPLWLVVGQTLKLFTFDASTGGTISYNLGFSAFQYLI